MPSLIVIHPSVLPARWNLTRPNNTCNNIFKARWSILNSAGLNRWVITTSANARHERLFDRWGSFAEKQQRVCPYFQYFSTNYSCLPFLSVTTILIKNCTIQLVQVVIFTKFHHQGPVD
jgi:hypothetical protein